MHGTTHVLLAQENIGRAILSRITGDNIFRTAMWNKLMKCDCAGACGAWAPLVLRFALGAIFAWHGYDKVFTKGIPAITGFLGGLGFPTPEVFAYILSYGELVVGILLILGLCTHWAAKFGAIVAAVAFLTVHVKNGFAVSPQAYGYEFIMLIFASAVSLVITGAGRYSLDEMWLKKKSGV